MKTKAKAVFSSGDLLSSSGDPTKKKINFIEKKSMSDVEKPSSKKYSWMIGGRHYRWDVDTGVTPDLLLDTGATFLESDSEDEDRKISPPVQRNRPRFLKTKLDKIGVSSGSLKVNDPQFIAQDYILLGRPKTSFCDHFEKLSDEIILHIFKMLGKAQLARCMATCKRWRRLACDESLWKHIDLCHRSLTGDVLKRVLDRGVLALRLALSQVHGQIIQDNSGPQLYKCRLQYLDLSMTTISVDTLNELLSLCLHLRKLSLEHCNLSDETCSLIANSKELEVLNISMCSGVTSVGIGVITSKCRKLLSWNLAWTHLSSAAIQNLCSHLPSTLRRLNISGCKETLSEENLCSLTKSCPSLVELDISNSQNLSSAAVPMLISGFPSLQHLHASHCYSIAPVQFVSLSKLPNLRHLEVFGILTDAALATLRHSLPGVEVNRQLFSTVARPTTGFRRTSIWGISLH